MIYKVFLIFRAGRASVNCLRNERRKIFRTPYFSELRFYKWKEKQRIQEFGLEALARAALWFVGSACTGDQQIGSAGATWASTHPQIKASRLCSERVRAPFSSTPESININDGWEYFSSSTFHFNGSEPPHAPLSSLPAPPPSTQCVFLIYAWV